MVNEREDRYEGHDEGEYHFSDDQSTYELEPEVESETESPKPPTTSGPKESVLSKLNPYRRMIIGVVVFVVSLFIVYKLIMPASISPAATTEFSEQTPSKAAAAKPITPSAPVTQAATVLPVQQPNPVAAPPSAPAMAVPVSNPPAMAMPQQQPTAPAPVPQQMQQPVSPPPALLQNQPPQMMATPAAAPIPPPPTTAVVTTPTAYTAPVSPGGIYDRLNNLEQQNSKIMSMLDTEYAQKLSEAQSHSVAMQAKIHEMNTRLANMETTLNQLTQAILNKPQSQQMMPPPPGAVPVGVMSGPPPLVGGKGSEPKMAYTVQAIIPGRAWLKSDSGDTVTVAEGDILKDYGRIIKIDPYDGIVEIDTGNKTISLSYGSTGD